MPENPAGDQIEFRNLLVEQKRKLWAELREDVFRQTGEELSSQYEMPQDPGERSVLDELADAGLAVAEIRRTQLTDLDAAQRRLESGTYGRCEGCGEAIDLQRLRLVPFTPYCVQCQKEQEGPSKPPGSKL